MKKMHVCILDIEPIHPPFGGSRLRIKGLYESLGSDIEARFLGAYHWSGPTFRRFRHGENLEETTVPFSHHHLAAAAVLQANIGTYDVIDSSFPLLAKLSPEYCQHACKEATQADVVIFSHPWVYSIVRDVLEPGRQLVVYDAHNVEALLKPSLLGNSDCGRMISEVVESTERVLCANADLIVTCSQEDRQSFAEKFDVPFAKMRVSPNGVSTKDVLPAGILQHTIARFWMRFPPSPIALFIGGLYPPNIEAAEFICDELAPACKHVTFAIVGAVGEALGKRANLPGNVRVTGGVNERDLRHWLQAADIAINPMFSGSGTNVKMLDYMSAGLAVVTSPFGARGICGARFSIAQNANEFICKIGELTANDAKRRADSQHNRGVADHQFNWANISSELGFVLANQRKTKSECAPYFSIVVPTLDRPAKLRRLLDLLAQQRDDDFEVIVVDQSTIPFSSDDSAMDLTIIHSAVRGQVHARNLGANVARGKVIVCTDDDCEPPDTWLSSARTCFDCPDVVGVEGRCFSDHMHDPDWRPVHNYGVEGLGFMTCNMFVTSEAFHAIGGFDIAFDEDQFRYDTDLGWRLQAIGNVPFSEAAYVYHPPWRRCIARESTEARDLLFQADAILLKKHPDRYEELFEKEGHWRRGDGFWQPFLRGLDRHDVALPDFARKRLALIKSASDHDGI